MQKLSKGKLTFFDCDKFYPLGSIRDLNQDIVDNLGPWDYQFEFAKGIWALPDRKEDCNRPEEHHLLYLADHLFDGNFQGLRVLDLGCNFGHFSLKAAELGAKEVVGVELRKQNLLKAAFARSVRNAANVIFYQGMVEDATVEELGEFDIVIIAGVFFHLTQPVQVLENIFQMALHGVLIDTNIIPSLLGRPIIEVCTDNPQKDNWGIRKINFQPSVPALREMVEAIGFREILEVPIKNQPYLPNGMWLDHRTPDKIRRQVFYVFKNGEINVAARKAFPSPWCGMVATQSGLLQRVVRCVKRLF